MNDLVFEKKDRVISSLLLKETDVVFKRLAIGNLVVYQISGVDGTKLGEVEVSSLADRYFGRMADSAIQKDSGRLAIFKHVADAIENAIDSVEWAAASSAAHHGESQQAEGGGHYAYTREKRREMVRRFRRERANGEITNIEAWAQTEYQITARTLLKYRREFPRAEKSET
jgi:hypothetical protein